MQELADLFSMSAMQRSQNNFFKLPDVLSPTHDAQVDEENQQTITHSKRHSEKEFQISFTDVNEEMLKEIGDQPEIVPQILTDGGVEIQDPNNDEFLVVAEGKWP